MQMNRCFLKRFSLVVLYATFSCKLLMAQSTTSLPINQMILPSKRYAISFKWQGDSIELNWEANAAMLIPVRLKNCPRLFYMQFDSGSPYSLLYQNKIDAIQSKYPKSFPIKIMKGSLQNFSFKADNIPFFTKEMVVKQFDSTSINWNDEDGIEIIGTLGTDFIDGKVAIIDYPHCKLTITNAIPGKLLRRVKLATFIYANRSILLPAKINAKETILYFDTGSSMYELLTNKETCEQLAIPSTRPNQTKVKSWDKFLTANTLASNDSIEVASTTIPIHSSTYIEGISNSQIEYMAKMGIGGMTGNKLFLNYILILDTKNQKFGVIQPF